MPETAKWLEEVETELGELGETIQGALDKTFQEDYEVRGVMIDKKGLIVVTIDLLPEED